MRLREAPPPASSRLRLGAPLLIAGVLVLAVNLRAAITGLPPVFPELGSALHLSASNLALLAAIPVLCFGVFSGAGAPLSRRLGEERVLGLALTLLAVGLLLRSLSPHALLFPGTIAVGAAIALMNVLLPSLVKRRVPEHAGVVIGLYLLMLTAGAVVASLIAVPVFTAAGGGLTPGSAAVRISLGLWAGPALLAVLVWLPQLGYRTVPEGPTPAGPRPLPRRGRARPLPAGLAGDPVHGTAEPVLLRDAVLVSDHVPGPGRQCPSCRRPARADEPR